MSNRQNQRSPGPRPARRRLRATTSGKALESMISRCMRLSRQPPSSNSAASQSSSSGCVARRPDAEVVGSRHDARGRSDAARPVDHHPGRQRVAAVGQPLRQRSPLASPLANVVENRRVHRGLRVRPRGRRDGLPASSTWACAARLPATAMTSIEGPDRSDFAQVLPVGMGHVLKEGQET